MIEERIDAELALLEPLTGLVSELEELVAEHPLRERLHGQLMLALYRSQRQAEALEVYRRLRRHLVEDLGIEPSPALQELERAILTQDRSLGVNRSPSDVSAEERSILVVGSTDDRLKTLLTVAEPLATQSGKTLILGRPVEDERHLAKAAAAANAHRGELNVPARVAAFTTSDRAGDVIRLTESYDVSLVLLDAAAGLEGERLPDELAAVLERSPSDVAILAGPSVEQGLASGVVVPFGGGEHDWAALELAAWLATASRSPLRLLGTRATQHRRDASRLLADAAIAVQRLVDVETEPLLADPTEDTIAVAVADASAVVVGISPRWQREGIGASRQALLHAGPPVLLVHHGLRPGGLAPHESRSRFTWSLQA